MREKESKKIFSEEVAWIKKPDPNNVDDIEAIERIDTQSEVAKWMVGPALTREDFLEENFYGICGEKDEKGMEGFVYLYDIDGELVDRLIEQKLIDSKDAKILEIRFARCIDSNASPENRKKGLVSSAVRQVCFSLLEKEKNVVIVAFTNPQNLPSEGVLKNAGFIKKGKILYDKESKVEDNFWILDKRELEKVLRKEK
jgi:RimJ/RimL family protein N-acetyltransferase